jgi:hypothetical protein
VIESEIGPHEFGLLELGCSEVHAVGEVGEIFAIRFGERLAVLVFAVGDALADIGGVGRTLSCDSLDIFWRALDDRLVRERRAEDDDVGERRSEFVVAKQMAGCPWVWTRNRTGWVVICLISAMICRACEGKFVESTTKTPSSPTIAVQLPLTTSVFDSEAMKATIPSVTRTVW